MIIKEDIEKEIELLIFEKKQEILNITEFYDKRIKKLKELQCASKN